MPFLFFLHKTPMQSGSSIKKKKTGIILPGQCQVLVSGLNFDKRKRRQEPVLCTCMHFSSTQPPICSWFLSFTRQQQVKWTWGFFVHHQQQVKLSPPYHPFIQSKPRGKTTLREFLRTCASRRQGRGAARTELPARFRLMRADGSGLILQQVLTMSAHAYCLTVNKGHFLSRMIIILTLLTRKAAWC